MTALQWHRWLAWAAKRAQAGNPSALDFFAQAMADCDTAKESLIAHGYGGRESSLLEMVAYIIERESQPGLQ